MSKNIKRKVGNSFSFEDTDTYTASPTTPQHAPCQTLHTYPHFIWDSHKAWQLFPEMAQWLEEVVMPSYGLSPHDRRVPLSLLDIWEKGCPGCIESVVGGIQ